jgi:hypothetical protein
MLLGMLGSSHGGSQAGNSVVSSNAALNTALETAGIGGMTTGLMIVLALVVLLQLNGIFGKVGPMASVKGVIHSSIALAVVCLALLQLV